MKNFHLKFRPLKTGLLAAAVLFIILAGIALAIPITIIDDAGPDDEPGQKDLNELTVDFAPSGSDLEVTWNWDVTEVSGANTGDACSLYDTDNDGNANYSLCVIWNDSASYLTTRLYDCGDGAADKCDQSRNLRAEDMNFDGDLADAGEALVGGPYSSTCSLSVVADTFGPRGGAQGSDTQDTQAMCIIDLDDFGGGDAFLINVCSYPSQVPGSDPSDCVVSPNSGFLTIVKNADPDDDTTFTFNLGPGQTSNDGRTSFSIDGSGSVNLISFPAGTQYDLTEIVPDGWKLDSASCVLSDGSSTGTPNDDTMTDIEIQVGRETTCTFTNTEQAKLTLVKSVTNDNGGMEVESAWTLSADGTDDNDLSGNGPSVSANVEPDTFTLSESGPSGYSLTSLTCNGGTLNGDQLTLAAGDDVTCTFVNDDDAPSLILAKTVINDNGGTAVASDWDLSAGSNTVEGSAAGTQATNQVGTYDLSEADDGNGNTADYTQTSLTCSDNPNVEVTSVTIGLGETITCTFVNDDDAPSLILAKTVINDNGGTAVASDWDLSAGSNTVEGSAAGTQATDQAGTYDLSEADDGNGNTADYTQTSLTCSDNPNVEVTSVTIGLGETITCTFVNDDDAPSLILAKTVINDNGGTAVASDWDLSAGSNTVEGSNAGAQATDQAGTYDLSEADDGNGNTADYTQTSLTCSDNPNVEVTSVTIDVGETITCTFVNDDDAPSLILAKTVINDNGGTAVASDWDLSAGSNTVEGSNAGAQATDQAGTYDLSEADDGNGNTAGYTQTSLTCSDNPNVEVTSVTIDVGETITCTFVNDDDTPSLKLVKVVENGDNPGGSAAPNEWTLSASGPTGFSGTTGVTSDADFDAGTYDLSESGPIGYLPSDWVCVGGNQTDSDSVTIGLGDDVICTITNKAMGMVTLLKTTNGSDTSTMNWNFTLTGEGVNESDSTPPTTVDFGGVKLIPGEEYTLCETGLPSGWTQEWMGDTNGDGVPDAIIPMVSGVNDDPVDPTLGYSRVYDPNYVAGQQNSNEVRCVNFVVEVGETKVFSLDNAFPGGEPRTIGFWKNWNTCTGGNQPQTAANNGGPSEGWYILDDLLNDPGYTIGILQLGGDDCEDAVNILDKRDIQSGKKKASDAAYNLAAQLLAAELNLSAGAETCDDVVNAVNEAQSLLVSIQTNNGQPNPFNGTGNYLRPKDGLYSDANSLAATLDAYNNGNLCSP